MKKCFFLFFSFTLSIVLVGANETWGQGISRGPFAAYLNEEYNGICNSEDLNGVLTNAVELWYQEMEDNLFVGDYVLNYIRPKRYVDISLRDWGRDYEYLEDNNILLSGGHGGVNNTEDLAFIKLDRARPDYPDNCTVWPHNDMLLGESILYGDIEIFHVLHCSTMTVDDGIIHNTWQPVFGGVHQVNGFHGIASTGYELRIGLSRLAIFGQTNSVGEQWVDQLYEENIENGLDNCPITYEGGNTFAGARYRLFNETYWNRDTFSDIDQPPVFVYYYIEGCDPQGGSEL